MNFAMVGIIFRSVRQVHINYSMYFRICPLLYSRLLTFNSCVIIKIIISYVASPQALSHPIFKNPLLTKLITKIVINQYIIT